MLAFIGLIIGGSSCVGKTTLAKSLCAPFDLTLVQTDRILPNNPTLNPLAGSLETWDRPPQELCELLIAAAKAATPYIIRKVEVLAASRRGWVVEGERVHPELVERLQREGQARGVFIVETDGRRLHDTLLERLPGFSGLSESRQLTVAEVDRLYNLWLINEATSRGLCFVAPQPWVTLADRTLAAL